jgi:hypothetical protein
MGSRKARGSTCARSLLVRAIGVGVGVQQARASGRVRLSGRPGANTTVRICHSKFLGGSKHLKCDQN